MTVNREPSSLGYAILGLVHQAPRSGYDLRKAFTATPLAAFSDSPGAIYPALYRLEKSGWVEPVAGEPESGRRRLAYRLTPRGRSSFVAWLRRLPRKEEVVRQMDGLVLRFAFMGQALPIGDQRRFLEALQIGVEAHLAELEAFLAAHGDGMSSTGRLAFESGLEIYRMYSRWARESAARLAGEEGRSRRRR